MGQLHGGAERGVRGARLRVGGRIGQFERGRLLGRSADALPLSSRWVCRAAYAATQRSGASRPAECGYELA